MRGFRWQRLGGLLLAVALVFNVAWFSGLHKVNQAQADDAVVAAVQRGIDHAAARGVSQSVFVLDRTTGQVIAVGGDTWRPVQTRSLTKVPIAAYWLLRGGGSPNAAPCDMWRMITESLNEAAHQCFTPDVVPTITARYGLASTNAVPGQPYNWADVTITAQDAAYMVWHMLRDPAVAPWLDSAMRNNAQDFGFAAIPGAGSKQGWGNFGIGEVHSVGYTDAVVAAVLQTAPSANYGSMFDTATYTARQIHEASYQYGGIGQHFYATGARNLIGYPNGPELCGLVDGGCWRSYQRGRIYWSPRTGPRIMTGEIMNRWGRTGSEWGSLSYPVTDPDCNWQGCRQQFLHGYIFEKAQYGPQVVAGAIAWNYLWHGGPGMFGYPVGEEFTTDDGWAKQYFESGRIFWHPTKGTALAYGGIGAGYVQAGGEQTLGYPTSGEICDRAGCVQHFERGRITWDSRGPRVHLNSETPSPTPSPSAAPSKSPVTPTPDAEPNAAASSEEIVEAGAPIEPSASQTSATPVSLQSSTAKPVVVETTSTKPATASPSADQSFTPTVSDGGRR